MRDVRIDFLFTLYFIGRRIKGEHKKHNEDCMLQATILHLLSQKNHTLSELSKKVYSKLSALSEKIAYLERDGLVKRDHRSEDGREVVLSLTPLGVTEVNTSITKMKQYCTAFTKSLTDSETKTVTRLLQKLII